MEDKNLDKHVEEIINLRGVDFTFPTTLNDILSDLQIDDRTRVVERAVGICINNFKLTDPFTMKLKDFLDDELIKK